MQLNSIVTALLLTVTVTSICSWIRRGGRIDLNSKLSCAVGS